MMGETLLFTVYVCVGIDPYYSRSVEKAVRDAWDDDDAHMTKTDAVFCEDRCSVLMMLWRADDLRGHERHLVFSASRQSVIKMIGKWT